MNVFRRWALGKSTYSHSLSPNFSAPPPLRIGQRSCCIPLSESCIELASDVHTCSPTDFVLAEMVGLSKSHPLLSSFSLETRGLYIGVLPRPCDREL